MAGKRSVVVGIFEDYREANQAVAALRQAGFGEEQIGIAMRQGDDASWGSTAAADADAGSDSYAEEGGLTGALAGLGLGALAGLGVLAGVIPVVGPAIAGGTLGIILSNAAAGAGIAGLAGALIGAGIPEEEATFYEGEFQAGRTIVTVKADGRVGEAEAILRQYGATNLTTRGVGPEADTGSYPTGAAAGKAAGRHAADTIQVREERLKAETTPVEAGEVRVRKEVRTETQRIDVPVEREEVVIERTPVHGKAQPGGTVGGLAAGEELRIPVREDQVRVTKEAVVTEEVKVGKRTVRDTEAVAGEVRKEEVRVEREGDVDIKTKGKPGNR